MRIPGSAKAGDDLRSPSNIRHVPGNGVRCDHIEEKVSPERKNAPRSFALVAGDLGLFMSASHTTAESVGCMTIPWRITSPPQELRLYKKKGHL
jgi:hypothetical protein